MMEKKKQSFEELKEIANKKAIDLTNQLGKKVYGEVINTEEYGGKDGEWLTFYIKAPSLYQKAGIIDSFNTGNKTMKGIELLRTNLLKEHSHPRFSKLEDVENENIVLGAALFITGKGYMFSIVEQSEEIKKNGE